MSFIFLIFTHQFWLIFVIVENYSKGENVDVELKVFVPGCIRDASRIVVSPSTKMRDIITVALDRLKTEEQLLWIGSGPAAVKAVSCVEVVKRRIKTLHQITQLAYKMVEEYWDPKQEGLDRLKVTREVPTVVILLSKQPLDPSVPGYQPPGSLGDDFCKQQTQQRRHRKDPRGRYEDKDGTSRYYKDQNTNGFRGENGDLLGEALSLAQRTRGRGGHRTAAYSQKQFSSGVGGSSKGK